MEGGQVAGGDEAVVLAVGGESQDRVGERGLVYQCVGGEMDDPVVVEIRPLEPAFARLLPEAYVGTRRGVPRDLAGLVAAPGQPGETAGPVERRAIRLGVAHGEREGGAGEDRVAQGQQS